MDIPLILCNSANYTSTRSQTIQYIVMHYTANNGDTARNNGTYFQNNSVSASAHYFVDEDEFIQSVPDSSMAWHCGATYYKHATCRNANSLGIELCSRIDSSGSYYFLDATVANAVVLAKYLMETYNVPIENVIRHYDVTGKTCPAPWVNNDSAWNNFLTALAAATTTTEETTTEEEEIEMTYYEKLTDIPDWAYDTVVKLKDKGYIEGEDEAGEILNIEHNMLRMLVINDRAGLYD